jgi:hypothetical protein
LLSRVTARITPAMYAELREQAGTRSVNDVTAEALQLWLDHQRAPKPEPVSPPRTGTPPNAAAVIAPADQPWHAYRVPPRRLGA